MGGNTRQMPIAVHLAEGNKSHLTKAEICERERNELKPANDGFVIPKFIKGKRLKNRFIGYSGYLSNLGIWDAIDSDTLGMYIHAEDQAEALTTEYERLIECGDIDAAGDILRHLDSASKRMQTFGKSLGITPEARCRMMGAALKSVEQVDAGPPTI